MDLIVIVNIFESSKNQCLKSVHYALHIHEVKMKYSFFPQRLGYIVLLTMSFTYQR